MRKQSIPGLSSPRGRPGIEANGSSDSTVQINIIVGKLLSFSYLNTHVDSVRTMIKYKNDPADALNITLDARLDRLFKECRGQRNFYITGFALFLIV